MKKAKTGGLMGALIALAVLFSMHFSASAVAGDVGAHPKTAAQEGVAAQAVAPDKNVAPQVAATETASKREAERKANPAREQANKAQAIKPAAKPANEKKQAANGAPKKDAPVKAAATKAETTGAQNAQGKNGALQNQSGNALTAVPAPSADEGVFVFRPSGASDASQDRGYATLGAAMNALRDTLDAKTNYDLFLTKDYTIANGENRYVSLGGRTVALKSAGSQAFTIYNAPDGKRHLIVLAGTLSLENVILDGKGGVGGLSANRGVHLDIKGGTVIRNTSHGYGKEGAVRMRGSDGNDGSLTIESGARFENNHVPRGSGGAIHTTGDIDISIDGATFEGNTSSLSDGGAIFIEKNSRAVTVSNTTFTNNSAVRRGGAISYFDNSGSLTLKKCTFQGNQTINKETTGSYGGAVYAGTESTVPGAITIEGCNFTKNSAYLAGGAISLEASVQAKIVDSAFIDNECKPSAAPKTKPARGGAIDIASYAKNPLIENCTFTNNIASNGGAIRDEGAGTIIRNSTFTGNSAKSDRGISSEWGRGGAIAAAIEISAEKNGLTIEGSTFTNNAAPNDLGIGGALYVGNQIRGNVTISGTSFSQNTARWGGAGYFEDTADPSSFNFTIKGKSSFTNNSTNSLATDKRGFGGALYTKAPLTIEDTTIEGNATYQGKDALGCGGGIYAKADLTLNSVTIKNNKAQYGGGVYAFKPGSVFTVKNSTIEKNYASVCGGGVYTIVNMESQGNTYANNSGKEYGGAIFANSTLALDKDTLSGNTVEGSDGGGAIYSCEVTTVTDSRFSKNVASRGGAIYAVAPITIKGGTFSENTANVYGGALAAQADSQVENAHFDHNKANLGGAIYNFDSANLSVTGATFEDNSATGTGGALYASGPTIVVSNTSFARNSAVNSAGAVFYTWVTDGTITIKDASKFEDNKAQAGGALEVDSGNAIIENSTFTGNKAILQGQTGGIGGALYAASAASLAISGSAFANNSAFYHGGAVMIENTPTTVTDSTFTSNSSSYFGGALYLAGQGVESSVTGGAFSENTAYYGGAIAHFQKKLTISGTKFTQNGAITDSAGSANQGFGGAIYAASTEDGSGLEVSGATFASNDAAEYGGAVFLGEKQHGSFSGGTVFANNHAKYAAGAIWVSPGARGARVDEAAYRNLTTAEDTSFKGNTASAWYAPPANAADLGNLKFASVSQTRPGGLPDNIVAHIVNNYDVNYYGFVLISYDATKLAEVNGSDKPLIKGETTDVSKSYSVMAPEGIGFTSDKLDFKSWNTKPDGTGETYKPQDLLTANENMTLYAMWDLVVKFDAAGGTPAPQNQEVAFGEKATAPADPAKDNFRFDGWFNGDTKWDFASAVNEPLDLKAHWTALHEVTFDAAGGTPAPQPETVAEGEKASKPADPVKDGYKALGWYAGDKPYDFNAPVTSNLALVMKWEKTEPIKPDNPDKPIKPDNPDKPIKPVKPDNPDKPNKPAQPVTPDKPAKPQPSTTPAGPVEPSGTVPSFSSHPDQWPFNGGHDVSAQKVVKRYIPKTGDAASQSLALAALLIVAGVALTAKGAHALSRK